MKTFPKFRTLAHIPSRLIPSAPSRLTWSAIWLLLGYLLGIGEPCTVSWAASSDLPRLTNQHIDLSVVRDPSDEGRLRVVVSDEDQGVTYPPEQVILVLLEASKRVLPADLPPLGLAGDPIWVAPQSADEALLHIGLSAEELDPGAYEGSVHVALKRVQGPGHFLLWQADAAGGIRVSMNSRPTVDPYDTVMLQPASHVHYNWGFTTNGTYLITLQATAIESGTGRSLTGPEVTFRFDVEPVPEAPGAPRLTITRLPLSDRLLVSVHGEIGHSYSVLHGTEWGLWQSLTNYIAASDVTSFEVNPGDGPASRRLYRAESP